MPEPRYDWLASAAALLTKTLPGWTPFAIEHLLVDGAIAAMQGPPKVGKTWLLADLYYGANLRVRLNEPDWRERLLAAAESIKPRAIFLDPLARRTA